MESEASTSPSPEEVVAGRVAYRQVRRYQKSSSTLVLAFFFFGLPMLMEYSHRPPADPRALFVQFFGISLFLIVHAVSRKNLKEKYERGSAILNELHSRYGLEVDKLLKPKLSLL